MSQIEPLYYDGGEPVYRQDVIHKDELRELVEEWRDPPAWLYNDEDAAMASRMCADELEERLNE